MKISRQATRGHLQVGIILVVLSLACFIGSLFNKSGILPFFVFFFGVWGGVELGRYLEHYLSGRNARSGA